ncbi:MAG: hypothetical protein K2X81_15830 [Candidatus Obscuribacterales bacterium]|nr:hypothetical protein [Candidatus Obscuribacterales bacterium]
MPCKSNKNVQADAYRIARSLLAATLSLFFLLSGCSCLAQSNLVERPKKELLPIIDVDQISKSDRELAEQIEVWPMFLELYDKKNVASALRKVELRRYIREAIIESYLDAASVQAEAERESSMLSELRQSVKCRRDKRVEINNAANFITAGTLNTIGSCLDFSTVVPPFEANVCQLLSGAVSTVMSTYALKQSNGGKTRGQSEPTVIAELFGRPCTERTEYPESVWRFLHGSSLDQPGKSRIQVLEERWIKNGYLEKHGSKREKLKLDFVSGVTAKTKSMTIDDLNDQIAMIADISEMTSRMTHHLRDLMRMDDSDIAN